MKELLAALEEKLGVNTTAETFKKDIAVMQMLAMPGMPTTGVFEHRYSRKPFSERPLMAASVIHLTLAPSPGRAQHVLRIRGTCSDGVSWSSDQGAPRAVSRAFVSKRKLVMLH